MNETELERLVVRLVGDGTKYMSMLEDVQKKTTETAAQVQKAGATIESMQKSIEGFAGTALKAVGALGISVGFWKSFQDFSDMEKNVIRMNAAIEQNGGNVQEMTARYTAFASQLGQATLMTKGQTLGLLRQAEAQGFTGDTAERLARQAIGLAGASDESADSMMRVAIALERGNVQMLRRIPQLRGIRNETELVERAHALMNQGMRVQEQLANTTEGKITRLKNSMKGLSKEVGALIADGIRPVVEWLQQAADWFNKLDPNVRKAIGVILAVTAALALLGPAIGVISTLWGPLSVGFGLISTALGFIAGLGLPIIVALAAGIGVLVAVWWLLVDVTQSWGDTTKMVLIAVGVLLAATLGPILLLTGAFIPLGIALAAILVYVNSLGGFAATWELIKSKAIDCWIAVQFGFQNFQRYAAYAWLTFRLKGLQAWEEMKHFFLVTFPEMTMWFVNHWQEVLTDFVNLGLTMTSNLATNVVNIISSIPDLITGATNWDDVWRPLTDGFESSISQLPNMTAREIGDVEAQLQQEWQREGLALDQSFQQFRAQRLAEMNRAAGEAANQGEMIGDALHHGVKHGTDKIDAVLSGSSEALARIAAMRDKLEGGPAAATGARPTGGAAGRRAGGAAAGGGVLGALDNIFNVLRDRIVGAAQGAWNTITGFAQNAWNTVVRFWNDLPTTAATKWEEIKQYAFNKWEEIKKWATDIFDDWDKKIAEFIDTFPEEAAAKWEEIKEYALEKWEEIKEWATEFFDSLPARWNTFWTDVQRQWNGFWDGLPERVNTIWANVQRDVTTALNNVGTAIQTAITNAISRVTGGDTVRAVGDRIQQATGGFDLQRETNNLLREISSRSPINLEGIQLPSF